MILSKSDRVINRKIIQHMIAFLKAVEVHHDSQVILLLPIEEDYSVFAISFASN